MAEWRFLEGWQERELDERLTLAEDLELNFDLERPLTPELGWDHVRSHALITREAKGPPEEDGAYERLWRALARFDHSDPRIVVAHFRDGAPLLNRHQLLELKSLGLRFLCPVEIGATREESDRQHTLRAFCLDTLDGHVERGREWFLLEKDHASGEVRFRIEAAWREGDFPNLWSRAGFELLGRRYQRAWHRLAHLRLRRIAAGLEPHEQVGSRGIVHEGVSIPTEPVQFYGQRGVGGWRVDVEQEREDMRRDRLWRALGLGALSGIRSMAAPAAVAQGLERRGRNFFSGRPLRFSLGRVLPYFAAGELLADKLPMAPARTQPLSVVARAASGAVVGSSTARKGESKLAPALLGGAAAVASTFASYRVRKAALDRSKLLGYVAAFAEDALVIGASARLAGITARAAL